jgi:hypothetical protein
MDHSTILSSRLLGDSLLCGLGLLSSDLLLLLWDERLLLLGGRLNVNVECPTAAS